HEEEGGSEAALRVAQASREAEEGGRGEDEPGEIEAAPHAVALAQGADHAQVKEIDPGHVHVEDVAIGHGALGHQPGDVMKEGAVVYKGPAPGAPAEIESEGGASGQNRLQSRARRSG